MLTQRQLDLRRALLLNGAMEALIATGNFREFKTHFNEEKMLDAVVGPLEKLREVSNDDALADMIAIFKAEVPDAVL